MYYCLGLFMSCYIYIILLLKVQMKINLFAIFITRTQLLTMQQIHVLRLTKFLCISWPTREVRDSLRGASLLETIIILQDELPLTEQSPYATQAVLRASQTWQACAENETFVFFFTFFLYLLKFNYETKLVFPFLDCQTPFPHCYSRMWRRWIERGS